MQLQKTIFTYLILCIIVQIFIACSVNTDKAVLGERTNLSNTQNQDASLQVINISNGKALLELSNKTNKPIYLAHEPSDIDHNKLGYVYYNLKCKEQSDKEYKDYGIHADAVLSLEPLEMDKSIRFEVNRLPDTQAVCRMSVMFYENENIADLINKKNPGLNGSEVEFIERSKRFTELTFDVL